jgi:WD40 repeat protein
VESWGIAAVSPFSDATREWVAYVDTSGADTNTIVIIYDILAKKELRRFTMAHWLTAVAFVPGQSTLLYSNGGNIYRVTESATSPETLAPTGVSWFAISPDGKLLAVWGESDGALRLYGYPGLALQWTIPVSVAVANIDLTNIIGFSLDSSLVAVAGGYSNTRVQVFSVSSGTSRSVATAGGATSTYSPTFSADGTQLYVGGGYTDGGLYVFDPNTGTQLKRFQPSPNYEYTVSRVPGFNELLVGGYDCKLQIIDASSGAVDSFFPESGGAINVAQFSPDGKYVYVGMFEGSGQLIVHRVN